MILEFQPDADDLAYQHHKSEIERKYPKGHFVALLGEQIIADAPTFEEVDGKLAVMGNTSAEVLVVQVGEEDPDFGWILNTSRQP